MCLRFILILSLMLVASCSPAVSPTPVPTLVAVVAPTVGIEFTVTLTASPTLTATATDTPRPTDTPTPTPTSTATSTWTPTRTPTATATPTPVPAFTLSGTVFLDYNGNGVRDDGEAPVSGATVRIAGLAATTGSDGSYTLRAVPAGRQMINVSAKGFRYLALSPEAFQSSDQPVILALDRDLRKNWGLMQGFLTLPFPFSTQFTRPSPFGMTGMVDRDRRQGFQRSYDPATVKPDFESNEMPPWIYDQHDGIDYCFNEGTAVLAAAPGQIAEAGTDASDGYKYIVLHHDSVGLQTLYGHVSRFMVKEGDKVARGKIIALSGNTGVSGEPHLHFRLATWTTPPQPMDPYRELADPQSVSYWTVNNAPQYPASGAH